MSFVRKPVEKREVEIIRRLKHVVKLPVMTIARAVGRHKKTVYACLKKTWKARAKGRPKGLSKKEVKHVLSVMRDLVKKANAEDEVTLAMIKKKARCTFSESTLRRRLRAHGVKFRKLRGKPILTKSDKKKRLLFAARYKGKSASWWKNRIHLHIDNKCFPIYGNKNARAYAAQRQVRGAYRGSSGGLGEGYVVASKTMRYNTGLKPAIITAGVGKGRVRLWHVVGRKWNGKAAVTMYRGALKQACERGWPRKRCHTILEDNDPTGFKSRAGIAAKKDAKLRVFALPPRSPDLNVCDYALWAKIGRNMRRQEACFPGSRRETRAEYLERLRKTAKRLPTSFIDKAIANMKVRCQRLFEARGGHFEEGGRRGTKRTR